MSISLRRSPRRWLVLASLMLSGLVSAADDACSALER